MIDGTGADPKEDQPHCHREWQDHTGGRREYKASRPIDAKVLDLSGRTVIPGLVGDARTSLLSDSRGGPERLPLWGEMADSAPRLYLASGVTTARTAGSVEPYTDLNLKAMLDGGRIPCPKLHITGPYLGGYLGRAPQMHTLTGPEDAARAADYWAAEGVTSFKAYMHITHELRTALEHAHAKGLKVQDIFALADSVSGGFGN